MLSRHPSGMNKRTKQFLKVEEELREWDNSEEAHLQDDELKKIKEV